MTGLDMTASDYDGRSALHLACAEGHLPVVRMLLEQCEVPCNPKDRYESPVSPSSRPKAIYMTLQFKDIVNHTQK